MLPALFGIVRRTEFSSIANQQTVLSSFLNDISAEAPLSVPSFPTCGADQLPPDLSICQ